MNELWTERPVSNLLSVGTEKTSSPHLSVYSKREIRPLYSKSRRTSKRDTHDPRKLDLHAVGPSYS